MSYQLGVLKLVTWLGWGLFLLHFASQDGSLSIIDPNANKGTGKVHLNVNKGTGKTTGGATGGYQKRGGDQGQTGGIGSGSSNKTKSSD